MDKISLEFIFDIISGHISGYIKEYNSKQISKKEMQDKVKALSKLEASLKDFLLQLKKLGDDNG